MVTEIKGLNLLDYKGPINLLLNLLLHEYFIRRDFFSNLDKNLSYKVILDIKLLLKNFKVDVNKVIDLQKELTYLPQDSVDTILNLLLLTLKLLEFYKFYKIDSSKIKLTRILFLTEWILEKKDLSFEISVVWNLVIIHFNDSTNYVGKIFNLKTC